jgi:hypothetical protein
MACYVSVVMDRRRARTRGVTPIGAAIAVFVFGVGGSCLWWAQSANAARDAESASRSDAGQIAAAAATFRAEHSDGCPTLSLLEEDHFLSSDTRGDDAWGNRFHLRCDDDQIVVSSAGPDGIPNDADDIRVPR